MSYTATATHTYSVADVEVVMRRFSADIVMMAQSSGAMSEADARKHAHDVTELASRDYLTRVDVTLLSDGVERRAACYDVRTGTGDLSMSRPGGVMWPRLTRAELRVVVQHAPSYDEAAKRTMAGRLKLTWEATSVDLSHASLSSGGGRDYSSNGWGLQRKDYAA
jgi:hypothetical protein